MAETGATKAFTSGDPVEATAFDPVHKRVLVSSHYGVIRMYSFGLNGKFAYAKLNTILITI
jgi:hypothetical protein